MSARASRSASRAATWRSATAPIVPTTSEQRDAAERELGERDAAVDARTAARRVGLERRGAAAHHAPQARCARAHAGTRSQNVTPTPGRLTIARRAAVGLGDAAHERQAEPGPPAPPAAPVERLEDRLLVAGGHAAALVGDLEAPAAARTLAARQRDRRRAARPWIGGVVEQVQQRALEPASRRRSATASARRRRDAQPVAEQRPRALGDALEERRRAASGGPGARRRGGRRSRPPPSRRAPGRRRRGRCGARRAAGGVGRRLARAASSSRRIARTGPWSSVGGLAS